MVMEFVGGGELFDYIVQKGRVCNTLVYFDFIETCFLAF